MSRSKSGFGATQKKSQALEMELLAKQAEFGCDKITQSYRTYFSN
jgi:hypothetical protein